MITTNKKAQLRVERILVTFDVDCVQVPVIIQFVLREKGTEAGFFLSKRGFIKKPLVLKTRGWVGVTGGWLSKPVVTGKDGLPIKLNLNSY